MTTPDSAPPPDATAGRVTRPAPQRSGPDRSGRTAKLARNAAAAAAPPPPGWSGTGTTGPAPPVRDGEELQIDQAVADAVKSAYDVLGETIEQGRRSAEQFRIGDYNIRDVPDDLRGMAGNMLRLVRQLSSTTLDICEALIEQAGPLAAPPPPGSTPVPPFRSSEATSAPVAPMPAPAASAGAPVMRLGLTFVGVDGAQAHTAALSRPGAPVAPDQISAAPLAPSTGTGAPISGVTFTADLVNGGLTATITVPAKQPGGIYTGAVFAAGQPLPLGLLVIELPG